MTALGMRVGGDTVAPGQARVVAVPLPGRHGEAVTNDSVPALVISGHRPGPRVAILAGARGFEVSAARLVSALATWMTPDDVTGTVVLVPVLRPGGRFAAAGRPIKPGLVWNLPGDPTGSRAARDAFAVSSALVGDSTLVLAVTEADPGRVAAPALKGDLDDPRARRLMRVSGATALLPGKRKPPVAVRPEGVAPDALQLELIVPGFSGPETTRAGGSPQPGGARAEAGTPDSVAFAQAAAVLGRLLQQAGVWVSGGPAAPAPRPAVCRHVTAIFAGAGGFVQVLAPPGTLVAKGEPLAHISPPLGRATVTLAAPQAGLVLEAPDRAGTRRGAKLFVLGRPARANGERAPVLAVPPPPASRPAPTAAAAPDALCLGWAERVSLPDLGLDTLAKLDTGARTSALHVTRMRTLTARGPQAPRRPLLELTIPRPGKRVRTDLVVRVRVHDYVQIKDSSGRMERRPVIETTLRLGDVQRKIRVTLTDRGDMTYPMLIGRTALGAGVVIDPARRHLLPARNDPGRKLT